MKKLILFLLIMAASAVAAPTYKVCYIISGSDTSTHNSNVDSLRYDIVNDPQGQLPGTWTMDLLRRADAEGKDSSYWNQYNVIITWGAEESGSNTYDVSIDGILDTIRKPVICRDGYVANGDPMWLGTTRITSLNSTNAPSHMRVNNASHFITRNLYTDEYNFGDSLALYALTSSPNTDGLTGMAHEVQTLLRMARDHDGDADSAVLVICEAGDTNANNTVAPAKRAFISINSAWRYCSWNARDLWYRTLRWAVDDTLIDTCVTQTRLACEAIDGNWMEYSGAVCQMRWHYGGADALVTGYQNADRVAMFRARTTAITTQRPDTSGDWAYDIVGVNLITRIGNIVETNSANSFSFWEGIFQPKSATLWTDYKTSIQLDSTCGSWSSGQYHALTNTDYIIYPSVAWNSPRAGTRGTDYESAPFDSIFVQDPVTDNYFVWDIPPDTFYDWAADSGSNQGVITHTCNAATTNDAEIQLISEQKGDASSGRRNSPQFLATLVWRAANTGAADLDSSILIQDPFGNDSMEFNVFVNGALPTTQTFVISNGSSSASFDCATTEESPAVDWATVTTIGGGTTTYYAIIGVDQTGLAAGYYYTWIKATCASVPDSPDSAKVVLRVENTSVREATGPVKIK